jgi:hypothetical protein
MLLPVEIENDVASINLTKAVKLTKKQLATLKNTISTFGQSTADRYLLSLLGFEKNHVTIDRIKIGSIDRLGRKQTGEVLNRFQNLLRCENNTQHVPSKRNTGSWVGVEIECFIPEASNNAGTTEGTRRRMLRELIFSHKIPRCSVKDDGSLTCNEGGASCEVTILFNTADGFEPLKKLLKILEELDCYTNDTCGLHVHLDVRHLTKKDVGVVGRRLGRSLPILKYLVDPERWGEGSYNKLEVSKFDSGPRQCAVNLRSYNKFKTVEVRLHDASITFKRMKHWIELLRFLSSVRITKPLETFQDFLDLGVPEHLIEYADKTITVFNPSAWSILQCVKS